MMGLEVHLKTYASMSIGGQIRKGLVAHMPPFPKKGWTRSHLEDLKHIKEDMILESKALNKYIDLQNN